MFRDWPSAKPRQHHTTAGRPWTVCSDSAKSDATGAGRRWGQRVDRVGDPRELHGCAGAPHAHRARSGLAFSDPAACIRRPPLCRPLAGDGGLRVGTRQLRQDFNATGLHFDSLVMRDSRVYRQSLGATLAYWRNSQTGHEVDAVLELPDGRWAGIEVKLGESAAASAVDSLLRMASKIDHERHGEAAALIVVTGGHFSYRHPDGVCVVPTTALGP